MDRRREMLGAEDEEFSTKEVAHERETSRRQKKLN